ncbi:MAG: hypothetical protein D3920_13040, partial [Candidatus Electrothrix sp. AW2]|nr:hypothetical protein [Candidatus Electrothrix gigas]
ELDAYLQAGDFQALQRYVTLQRYVADTTLAAEVNTWEKHINLFEYRQVAEKLAMLRLMLRNQTF